MFVSTNEAVKATHLTAWELRNGYKAGRYPAIEIGNGKRAKRLRWDLDLLQAAIRQQMEEGQKQRMNSTEQ